MRIGAMQARVSVATPTETNTRGVVTREYTTISPFSRWAEFVATTGREFVNAKAVNAELTHLLRMRYDAAVLPICRIVYDSRTFEVLSVVNVNERDTEMLVSCKEVV